MAARDADDLDRGQVGCHEGICGGQFVRLTRMVPLLRRPHTLSSTRHIFFRNCRRPRRRSAVRLHANQTNDSQALLNTRAVANKVV
jgi:hypothetical protein